MKQSLPVIVALALVLGPVSVFAQAKRGPAFEEALDLAGGAGRLAASPPRATDAPVIKIADFSPSNSNFLPEQYFKTRTTMTGQVHNNTTGEALPDVLVPREGLTARFSDGTVKYQFVYLKLYKGDGMALLTMSESQRSDEDNQGRFTEKVEQRNFGVPVGSSKIVETASSAALDGVDQGGGVLVYSDPADGPGAVMTSTRQVGADRSEDNIVSIDNLNRQVGSTYTLFRLENRYHYDPIGKEEFGYAFPERIRDFLKKFGDLHWIAVLQRQILVDCLAKAGGGSDRCADAQQRYDEAHAARHDLWQSAVTAAQLKPLMPRHHAPVN